MGSEKGKMAIHRPRFFFLCNVYSIPLSIREHSWDSWHDGILVLVCIVVFDFSRHKNLFQVKKEYNLVSWYQSVFHERILILDQYSNEGRNAVSIFQMCMQHIWQPSHISTFDGIIKYLYNLYITYIYGLI